MESYKVILIVDRGFGNRLRELPQTSPIWIVDTEINKPVVQALWKEKHENPLKGLTSFRDNPEFKPDALALSMIEIIDDHHGESSHNPPFSKLLIIGTPPTTLLLERLEDFGFRHVKVTDEKLEFVKED
jgi:hypothetical protein